MKKKPTEISPSRVPVLAYPTPDLRDVVFYINVESALPSYEEPEIGTLYEGTGHDKDNYANHKLSFVTKVDETGWVRWYYAADRADQGAYNFVYFEPTGGDTISPYYTRTYLVPRDEVDQYFETVGDGDNHANYLVKGSDDPDVAFNPEFEGFKFTGQRIIRSKDVELDSRYVSIERRFEKLCPKTSKRLNRLTGELDNVTETIVTKADATGSNINPATGEYTEVKAINCDFSKTIEGIDETGSMINIPLVGARYNVGTCNSDEVGTTIVVAGTAGTSPTDSTGAYYDVEPINKLFSKKVLKVDPNWSKLGVAFAEYKFNAALGQVQGVTRTVVKTVDVVDVNGDEPDTDGNIVEYNAISPCLSEKVERNIKPNADLVYWSSMKYHWPAVYSSYDTHIWTRVDGSDIGVATPVFLREKWEGLSRVKITRRWSATDDGDPASVRAMNPTAMVATCPLMRVAIPPCLHGAIAIPLSITAGGSSTSWSTQTNTFNFVSTGYEDWPTSLIIASSKTPVAGGFVYEEIEVYSPLTTPT